MTPPSCGDVEQIVGRERNRRACHRQLVRNVVDRRRVNSTVMWLRFSSLILFVTALCAPAATAAPRMKLTDRDRAAIVSSLARDLFRPGRNYEGKHLIL